MIDTFADCTAVITTEIEASSYSFLTDEELCQNLEAVAARKRIKLHNNI